MAEIHKVLTAVPYNEEQLRKLRAVFAPAEVIQLRPDDTEGIAEALKAVDVAVLGTDKDESVFSAPNIRWIHFDHAGLNRIARKEILDRDLIITGSAGRSAPALADHAVYFMLSFTFAFPALYKAQMEHRYVTDSKFLDSLQSLHGKTVGIIGMGNTGKELAKRAKAFEMHVLGYKRSRGEVPAEVDKMYYGKEGQSLDELLQKSDFVVLALPLTDATYHMIAERELKLMKPSAYLINMARGAVVCEKDLIRALQEGWIRGAGLDTFEQEPLPKESPLWDAPNTIITPHATPRLPDRTERSIEIIGENVRRYREGLPMLNRLKAEDMFSR